MQSSPSLRFHLGWVRAANFSFLNRETSSLPFLGDWCSPPPFSGQSPPPPMLSLSRITQVFFLCLPFFFSPQVPHGQLDEQTLLQLRITYGADSAGIPAKKEPLLESLRLLFPPFNLSPGVHPPPADIRSGVSVSPLSQVRRNSLRTSFRSGTFS